MGLGAASAAPAVTAATTIASISATMMRLMGHLLSSSVLGPSQRSLRAQDSQSHGGMPLFGSGNLVGASPYAVAFFEYFQDGPTSQLRRTAFGRSSQNSYPTPLGE